MKESESSIMDIHLYGISEYQNIQFSIILISVITIFTIVFTLLALTASFYDSSVNKTSIEKAETLNSIVLQSDTEIVEESSDYDR
jgi:heme/copper-type cytochrome/quinol oxidase subunit 2